MNLALRLARRELRGGLAGFRIFIACLALGVAVIAGVGSLSASLDAALRNDARALLGGDVDFHLFHRPASAAERAYLDRAGRVSEADDMRAMARNADGSQRSLIQLKAVDAAYPLYGSVTLDPPPAQPANSITHAHTGKTNSKARYRTRASHSIGPPQQTELRWVVTYRSRLADQPPMQDGNRTSGNGGHSFCLGGGFR